MDVPSDDLFAELFTKQLGVLFGAGGTITDGAQVIRGTISAAFGLHPTDPGRLGPVARRPLLAGRDRRPAARRVAHADRPLLAASLPTVGVDGTVRYIAAKTAAQGRCVAKTGTLERRHQPGRLLPARRAGQTLAFALMIDGPSNVGRDRARGAGWSAAIARY